MKKEKMNYVSPLVETEVVEIEEGFAASGGSIDGGFIQSPSLPEGNNDIFDVVN